MFTYVFLDICNENLDLELKENPSFPNFSAHIRFKDTPESFIGRAAKSEKVSLCILFSP